MQVIEVPGGPPPAAEDLDGLRRRAREFCASELVPHQERWAARHQVDRELWRRAGRAGLLGVGVPPADGGTGGSVVHQAVLVEEQARAADTAWGVSAHLMVIEYLVRFGSPEQRRRWLPPLVDGSLVGALAITEPHAGSDVGAVRTCAELDGDHYVVHGTKAFVTNGRLADLVVLAVRARPCAAADDFSLLVVETGGAEGFSRGAPERKTGRNGQDTCELSFAGTRVPAGNLLGGAPGQGYAHLLPVMALERLLVAVAAVATMETVLDWSVRQARRRTPGGGRPFSQQHVRFALARCATETAVTRTFVETCVRRQLEGRLGAAEVAMAKWWATDRLTAVTDSLLQVTQHGDVLAPSPVTTAWADSRVTRIFAGTDEMMAEIISRSL